MKRKIPQIFINLFFILATISFVVPFLLVISISISNEVDVVTYGFKLIPMHIDFSAYKMLFQNFGAMAWAIAFTMFVSVVGPFGTAVVCSMMAYPLSRPEFKWRKTINVILIFTMLFSGGLIPKYILNTQYLHLNNTVWIYLIPGVSAFGVILYRTFFSQIPASLIESAKIDGATNMQILRKIIVPMSMSIIMIQVFQGVVAGWNAWETSLYYITDKKLYTLQYLMQMYLKYSTNVQKLIMENPNFAGSIEQVPVETLRYAMAVVSIIPVFIVFPPMQKYFAKGMTVGAVKG